MVWGWSTYEEEVLVLLNERRAEGADCRSGGQFAPAGPLSMSPYLRCSSRFHSYWMGIIQDELMHESPGGDLGDDPWQRIASTGFPGSATGENIAAGYSTPEDVVEGWMTSDGHCANIMAPGSECGRCRLLCGTTIWLCALVDHKLWLRIIDPLGLKL